LPGSILSILLRVNTEVVIEDKVVLFSYRGRIRRSTFWDGWAACTLYMLLAAIVILALVLAGTNASSLWVVGGILSGPLLWVWLAVCAKRWHDLGLPAAMAVLNLVLPALPLVMVKSHPVPAAGAAGVIALLLILFLGFAGGVSGANKYGESSI